MLHYDNESYHSARLMVEFLEHKCIKVTEHPPYFLNFTMWLLDIIWSGKKGHHLDSEDEINEAIKTFFNESKKWIFKELNASSHTSIKVHWF